MDAIDNADLRDPQRAHAKRRDFTSANRLPTIAAIAALIGGCRAIGRLRVLGDALDDEDA